MIPFPSNQKLITCWATNVSRECNWIITPTLGFFQIKIENIYLFKIIIIKEHGNVFKTWLCPNFLLLPKKSELPKIWGGCSPPRPPGPYAYVFEEKEERKKTFWHLGYWKQWMISDQVWRMGRGFSQTQHNEHNGSFLTCHSDKPTCSRNLPRRDNGSGGPHFLCGSGGGAQLLVDYIYFFLLSTEVWKWFFLISR